MFLGSKRGYRLHRCSSCGVIFVHPRPEVGKLAGIYRKTSGYFATARDDLSKTSKSPALHLQEILSAYGIKTGRFLDVGCSTGALIYHMRRLGWSVAGNEINPDAAGVARQNNLDVQPEELEGCSFPEGGFDVIHMGDVVEHLSSPRQTLSAAHRLLRKGGLIVIKTPNAKSGFAVCSMLLSKATRFPWPHSEAPYHLHEFCPEALSRLVSSVGFEVLSVKRSGRTPFLYTLGATGFFDDLKISMKKRGRYRWDFKFLFNVPKLAVVAGILLPFYVWGVVHDMLRHTGSKITLIGRRL